MAKRFVTPDYGATMGNGERVTIDVTNSISAGLDHNEGLIAHVRKWMDGLGYTRILDFGAGALRHAIPLLEAGFEVTVVEYKRAFERPRAKEALAIAEEYDGFSALVWPHDFMRSRVRYDVALLVYVLQVIPVKKDREVVLGEIAKRFDRNGPRRLYYASRYGEARSLSADRKHKDGWVRGRGDHGRSFYTEWKADDTNRMFAKFGYERAGTYQGASQGFIYDHRPGLL
ncbi:MAG: hypothetical protein DHS20C21_01300 [Gemmatimonadota bacterium]|nr:MAG: hypothetical protein DHS20C21_01300 [Gemmatimonadota bacterium]